MTDFRQKQDFISGGSSGVDFRREVEELVRGHFGGCITYASCSSGRGDSDGNDDSSNFEEQDQLVRRRRRSDLEGDDLAESSAARRRQSRILSQWAARQAEEMMTTMERRNRESELMALARLHTVSMLDSSFLMESRRSASATEAVSVERPAARRASSILQRWREIEDESTGRERRTFGENRGREQITESRVETSESDESEYDRWSRDSVATTPRETAEVDEEAGRSSREESHDAGEGETERVRQIARGWMNERGIADRGSRALSPGNDSQRAEWLGETERERVRLVREWVQMASQQRDARAARREVREPDRGSHEGPVTDHEDSQTEHVRRDMLRIRGRQARLELIMRMARERQRELEGLSQHRAVSDFAHRNRIQSLLRGRFLRNAQPSEEVRQPSVAARELGILRQRHPVSGIREGFRIRLESSVHSQSNNTSEDSVNHRLNSSSDEQFQLNSGPEHPDVSIDEHSTGNGEMQEAPVLDHVNSLSVDYDGPQESPSYGNWEEVVTENLRREWQDANETDSRVWHGEESHANWQENSDRISSSDISGNEAQEDLLSESQDWREDVSNVTSEIGRGEQSELSERVVPVGSINRFIPPDDDNVYSMELRELLGRRSVSNLLSSDFRESLDQLIQSYVERRDHTPINWDMQEDLHDHGLLEVDHDQQRNDHRMDQEDLLLRTRRPAPPMPPAQPLWHQRVHHTNWRQQVHRPELESDVINDLKADMARLQQGMSHMQRMLEACMDMQLELQRSVKQEVSAALNRSLGEKGDRSQISEDGSKWNHVRKGTCCVCCDRHIDSLLYRCGHMCTCTKCAHELVRSGGKCPLCRAPIVEVIRAYSIM